MMSSHYYGIHVIIISAFNAVFPLLCNIAVRLHVHSIAGHRLDLCRHTPSHTGFVLVAVQSQKEIWLDILCPPKYVDIKNQWRARPLILFLCPQSTLHNSSLDTKTHATHPWIYRFSNRNCHFILEFFGIHLIFISAFKAVSPHYVILQWAACAFYLSLIHSGPENLKKAQAKKPCEIK